MRCPRCGGPWSRDAATAGPAGCGRCGSPVRIDHVAIDFVPDRPSPSAWGARAMQSGWLARAYEAWWRPVLFALSTRLGAPSSEEEAREVVRLVGDRAGPWLDVSCGPGTLLRHLVGAPGAPEVFGLDLSRAMLEQARVAAPGVTLVRGDAASLPFEDGSFGVVTNLAALDLYADPAGAVREAARVLARGGRWIGSSFIRRGAVPSVALASGVRTPSIEEIAEWTAGAGLGRLGKLLFRGYAIAWADKD